MADITIYPGEDEADDDLQSTDQRGNNTDSDLRSIVQESDK